MFKFSWGKFTCIPASFLAVCFLSSLVAVAAEQGKTTGLAVFNAKGDAKTHKPGVVVWAGSFVGVSVTDARKGPLHETGWDCTGEAVIQDGNAHRAGGFCLITDADGDTVNLLWERTNVPGPAGEPKTRGTYVSGTGKYSGIQGYYTFACRQGTSSLSVCQITGGEYKLP